MDRKIVKWDELEFTMIASRNNISPRVVDREILGGNTFMMYQEAYPKKLADIKNEQERCRILPVIHDVLTQLHDLGVVHGNINEESIVVDKTHQKVKLVNYSGSRWIRDLPPDNVEESLQSEVDALNYICGER